MVSVGSLVLHFVVALLFPTSVFCSPLAATCAELPVGIRDAVACLAAIARLMKMSSDKLVSNAQ